MATIAAIGLALIRISAIGAVVILVADMAQQRRFFWPLLAASLDLSLFMLGLLMSWIGGAGS